MARKIYDSSVDASEMLRIKVSLIHKATTAFHEIQRNVGDLNFERFDEMLQPIRNLYEFLKKDETVSAEISNFTFEEFYDTMLEINDFDWGDFEKQDLFIPVAALCYKKTLGFIIDFKSGNLLDYELKDKLVKKYFKNH